MFDTGETFEDIERWAEATFPHEFKVVKDYLRDNNIVAKDCDHEDEYTLQRVRTVTVGYLDRRGKETSVVAHFTPNHPQLEPRMVLCGNICDDVYDEDTHFEEPFCWLNPETTLVGFVQFSALIKFICLPSAMPVGVSIDAGHFKEHFEGACTVIAGELEEQRRQNGKCKWRFYYSEMAQL